MLYQLARTAQSSFSNVFSVSSVYTRRKAYLVLHGIPLFMHIPYSRKLSRGENFHEFRGFVAIRESKIGGSGILGYGKSEQSANVFSAKIVLYTNLQKFSPSKVFRYTVQPHAKLKIPYFSA